MKYLISLTLVFCALFLSGANLLPQASLKWNKYDFVPGDRIIFEDNQENEQNGEFPSKWDLSEGGSVENAVFGEDNVMYFKDDDTWIVPYVRNPDRDYLPDIFNIEFDAWFEKEEYCVYYLALYDTKNQAVADQLISMGIDSSRLTSKDWGETKPVSDNTSSEGKAANRRVEFVKK